MVEKIKFIIAALILIFIFLPLGSCERKAVKIHSSAVNEDSLSTMTEMQDLSSIKNIQKNDELDYLIPIKEFKFNEPLSWLMVIVFIWPLLFLATKKYLIKGNWKKLTMSTVELLFCGFSIYFLYSLLYQLWYEPTKWGYLAFAIIASYFVIILFEIFSSYLQLRLKKI